MIVYFTDELVNGVLKKDYLTKESHVRRNWKRRYHEILCIQGNNAVKSMCACTYVPTSVYCKTLADKSLHFLVTRQGQPLNDKANMTRPTTK